MEETGRYFTTMLDSVEQRLGAVALEEAEVIDLLTRSAWVSEHLRRRQDHGFPEISGVIDWAEALIIRVREQACAEKRIPPPQVGALELRARQRAKRLSDKGKRPPESGS